jgi:hypothetical protein
MECEETAKTFIDFLDSKVSDSSSKIGIAKTAIHLAWSSPQIKDFIVKLERLRNSWTLAAVFALRTSAERDNHEILAHLQEIQQEHHARKDQDARSQNNVEALIRLVQDQAGNTSHALQQAVQSCLSEINALRNQEFIAEKSHGLERDLLHWLDFRQITWRYDGVQKAYQQTYEWIFDQSDDKSRNDFTTHLEDDVTKPYFVNGKAGSGKSTLMKFIHGHSKTVAALKRWAGPNELVVLHFFFWNLGTTLQKSQVGMLRALLHEMLERFPELIPAVLL